MLSKLEKEYFIQPAEFRDPVHGDIRLYKYEIEMVDTRAFQRLRGIKQLAACDLVWFGATHTRYQHSLGTLAMSQTICENLLKRDYIIEPAKVIVIRLLALLHDIGHVPFGHTVEDERPVIQEKHDHKTRVRRIIQGDIEQVLGTVEELFSENDRYSIGLPRIPTDTPVEGKPQSLSDLLVLLITLGKGESFIEQHNAVVPAKYRLFLDVVSNTVCADLFDYLSRDTYFTGLRRAYDEKILSHLILWKERLAVDLGQPRKKSDKSDVAVRTRGGIVTEISNLLRVRYTLAERVYFNDTKSSASAMVSQAVESANVNTKALSEMRDDELLCYLENIDTCSIYEAKESKTDKLTVPLLEDRTKFLDLFEEEALNLWEYVASKWKPAVNMSTDISRKIVGAYKRRNIFRPVYRLRGEGTQKQKRKLICKYLHDAEYADFRRRMQLWIAEMCGLADWQVIIYCPALQMNVKVAKTHVGPLPGGIYKQMDKLTDEDVNGNDALKVLKVEADEIKRLHLALWSMEVMVDPEAPDQARSYASACSYAFFNSPNALASGLGSGLTLEVVRRYNLKEACATAGVEYNVPLEEQLLHSRSRGGILYTSSEFALELKKLRKQGPKGKGLF